MIRHMREEVASPHIVVVLVFEADAFEIVLVECLLCSVNYGDWDVVYVEAV
jgi:hypothetical protein